jgi:O-antigen/teichoic acid export membrane protein
VAIVGNYQMVMNNISLLVGKLFEGTNASVGNLVSENDIKKTLKVFWEFMSLRFFFAGCTSIALYIGFDDFLRLWLGEEYLLSHTILITLIVIFFMLQVRQPVDSFKQAYGLYSDIWAPVIQSVINLVLSIIFVIKYGILGVFLGTLISQFLITMLWKPYYMFKYGFNVSHFIYWKGFGFHLLYLAVTYAIYYYVSGFINIEISSALLLLFVKLLVSSLLFLVIYFSILITFSKGFKNLINRVYLLIKAKL